MRILTQLQRLSFAFPTLGQWLSEGGSALQHLGSVRGSHPIP